MRSPVKWALLGLVIERPSHAYELAQRLERRYGPTLPLSDTRHAYRAIKDLANRSLIERIPDAHESADSEPSEPSPSEPSGPSKPSYPRDRQGDRGVPGVADRLYLGEERQQRQLFILALSALTRQPEQMIEVVEHCRAGVAGAGHAHADRPRGGHHPRRGLTPPPTRSPHSTA